jgi:hypothetical protein
MSAPQWVANTGPISDTAILNLQQKPGGAFPVDSLHKSSSGVSLGNFLGRRLQESAGQTACIA